MDDASLVPGFERLRNLARYGERFLDRDGTISDALGQRRSLDELEDECLYPIRFLETVDARDVRMVERRERLGFPLEPRQALVVVCEFLRENLDRNVAVKLRIAGAVDLSMPPLPIGEAISYGPRRVPAGSVTGTIYQDGDVTSYFHSARGPGGALRFRRGDHDPASRYG